MAVFTQKTHRSPGRFLQWKVRLFAVGAVMLVIGMAREISLVVAAAIAVLAVAFVLRFFERDDEEVPADEEQYEPEEEDLDADEPPASNDEGGGASGNFRGITRRTGD